MPHPSLRSSNAVAAALLASALLPMARLGGAETADWPQFRGPGGQGHAQVEGLPLSWSPTENIAWRAEIPGKGWSSPIVAAGGVFVTTAVAAGRDPRSLDGPQSLRAVSLDARSGKARWNVEVFRQGPARIQGKNSHASPTPLWDGERLYVHFGPNGTAALDADGKVLWRNRDIRYPPVHGAGGSPALAGELLVFACDGASDPFVVALDRASGEERWRKPRPASGGGKLFAFSTPLLIEAAGKRQLVLPGANLVSSYVPETGEEIWRVRYDDGYSVVPRPVYSKGLVFLSTGYDRPELLAIRPDGKGDVTDTHVAWRTATGVSHNPSFLAAGDTIVFVSDKGIASCRDARTGAEVWRERIGGNHSASPILAGDRIYFLDESGETVVIAAGREFRVLSRNRLDDRALASPAAVDGALFLRTERAVWRIEERNRAGEGGTR